MSGRVSFLKRADRYVGGTAARLLGRWNFSRTSGPPFVEIKPGNVRHVLFIRPGGIGDLLLSLPAVRTLRATLPGVRVTLVGERRNRAVADLTDLFDEVLTYDGNPLAFLQRLRRGGFDAAVDSEQFHYSSSVFAVLSRAPVRIGFKTVPARNDLYTHLVDYPMDRHESEAFGLLVRPFGVGPVGLADTRGLIDRGRLPATVPGLPPDPGELVSVFAYGGAREKAWPATRWSEIVRRLLARGRSAVALVGGLDSLDLAREIVRTVAAPGLVSLVGSLSFAETAAVLARSHLYVGADTGVTHLAVTLGVPTVAVYGPSDERKWGPPAGRGTAVSTSVPCRPCSIFGYYKLCRTIDCMERISQDAVWNAIEHELARS